MAYSTFLPLCACARSHYTGHFKSVVTKHQNVLVMKDIMANGYRAGGNTKFFGTTKEEVRDGLMARLNMDDTNGDQVLPSMLAFPMTIEQYDSGNMDIAMSVTSRFLPYEVAGGAHNSFPGGETMYKAYDLAFGLRAVHFGEDLRASENMEYMSQVRPPISTSIHDHRCHQIPLILTDCRSFAHRARPTTRSASSARTASTTASPRHTPSSSRVWAIGDPMLARGTPAGAVASRST